MSITGPQNKQLQSALLAAYNRDELRRVVKIGMDMDFDAVAPDKGFEAQVDALVAFADRQGRISDLIAEALRQNSTSPDLQTLAEAAKGWKLEPPAEPDATAPYQGLAFFDVLDADRFFGRETLTAELVAYLKDHRFLAVVGASGSGKSSVVRAGVVPALQKGEAIKGSDKWTVRVVTPTARPLTTLAASLTQDSESVTAQITLMDDMSKDARSLDLFASRLAAKTGVSQLLLVVDQFEELFTLGTDRAQQQAYVDNLLAAAAPDGVTTVIVTLRADFYAQCAQFDNLRTALQESQKYIGPMSQDELRAAIENPAATGGWDLEPGLTNRLLKDVADQPGALPLLSHALLETWKRRSGHMLTLAGYEASGGVQGAIAHTADDLYGTLSPEQQAMVRNVFVRLTSLGEGVQDTRRRVPIDELVSGAQGPQMEVVLKRLEDARLVTAEKQQLSAVDGAGQQTVYVDVAHEALIRQWPLLRRWLDDDREGLRVHRRLTEASDEWEDLGRDPGSLFRGALLAQTAEWAKTHDGDLNDQERAFLDASQGQVEAEKREREAAQQRELANAMKVRNLLVGLLAVVGAALVLAGVVVWYVQGKNVELDQKNVEVSSAKATAEANYNLAQQKLDDLKFEELMTSARDKKAKLDVAGAVADFKAAAAAAKGKPLDVSAEISDTLRYAATQWVLEGESLLRAAKQSGSDRIWQQAVISASTLFSQALALNPPSDTPVYVWIEPGSFVMGSTDEQIAQAVKVCNEQGGTSCDASTFANEQPSHPVQLDGYWMLRTEVTNEQYKRCVDMGMCDKPNNPRWDMPQNAKKPVTHVDWTQASKYAAWVGGRLPTEAEWEYACRGHDGRIYPWGNEAPTPDRLIYSASGYLTAIDVGSYAPGANGLYDMAGNVWEWTADWYGESYYKDSPARNPTGPTSGDLGTLHGGSFYYNTVSAVRCAARGSGNPSDKAVDFGFRVLSPGS